MGEDVDEIVEEPDDTVLEEVSDDSDLAIQEPEEKEEIPVILDLESVRVLRPGKYEIDVVNLFSKKRPLIYKLEEGKYIIDLASTIKINAPDLQEEIEENL